MVVRSLSAAGLLLVLGAASLAAECKEATQADLNACAAAERERADAAMNAAYGRLMKQIGPRAQAALKDAQRAWLPYRDRTCDLEALGAEGGSVQPMVRLGCLAEITTERTRHLTRYLTCQEGDIGCVGRLAE